MNVVASVTAFLRALLSHWFTAMSGPLSVPTAIVAFWVENQTAKTLLAITAFVCAWSAAYRVWKVEHEEVVRLRSVQTADDPLAAERKHFVDQAFLGLGRPEIEWLDRIAVSGRPTAIPDQIWITLERCGLVDRDFTGPKGIKDELKATVRDRLSEWRTQGNSLQIIVSGGSKYRDLRTNPQSTTQTISIGLRNAHQKRRLTNCGLSLRLPDAISVQSFALAQSFTLEPGEERLIPVAYHHDFVQPDPRVRDCIRIPTSNSGGYLGAHQPELPITHTSILLRAESAEANPRDMQCRIFLDDARRLHLEELVGRTSEA